MSLSCSGSTIRVSERLNSLRACLNCSGFLRPVLGQRLWNILFNGVIVRFICGSAGYLETALGEKSMEHIQIIADLERFTRRNTNLEDSLCLINELFSSTLPYVTSQERNVNCCKKEDIQQRDTSTLLVESSKKMTTSGSSLHSLKNQRKQTCGHHKLQHPFSIALQKKLY